MSPSSPRQAPVPPWKNLLGALSLLVAALIWTSGLVNSLSRPSVAPSLNLQQQEVQLLAEPALPDTLGSVLRGGENPRTILKGSLEQIPAADRSWRQTQLLDLLQNEVATVPEIDAADDPLLDRLLCEARGGASGDCINPAVARSAAVRLSVSALLPLITAVTGTALLLGQGWRLWRGRRESWPDLKGPTLTLLDMALLVAGGFVVISAVGVPLLVLPLVSRVTAGLDSPRREAVGVVINYSVMALPSLLILRRQLASLPKDITPEGGWLQWRWRPLSGAFFTALAGWCKVTPIVVLAGWLLVRLFGDPGGSNPLLELVLDSRDPLALSLLALTAVVLAPLFEEVIFRGTLLPVLARRTGSVTGVVLSGLLFGVAHISIGELAPLTVLGIGLALVRLSSGRLFPCVLMHALWNAVTFVNLLLL